MINLYQFSKEYKKRCIGLTWDKGDQEKNRQNQSPVIHSQVCEAKLYVLGEFCKPCGISTNIQSSINVG